MLPTVSDTPRASVSCLLSRPQKVPRAGGDQICFAPGQIPKAKHRACDQEKLKCLVTDRHCSVGLYGKTFFKFSTLKLK